MVELNEFVHRILVINQGELFERLIEDQNGPIAQSAVEGPVLASVKSTEVVAAVKQALLGLLN